MIHDIWVLLRSDSASRSALQHAVCLADLYQSTVNGLALAARSTLVGALAGAPRDEPLFASEAVDAGPADGPEPMAVEFAAECRRAGVGYRFRGAVSEPNRTRLDRVIRHMVRRSELLCLGGDAAGPERPGRLVRRLIRVAPCPIWVSFGECPIPAATSIWVAYDGARPADRALSRAATLAGRMGVGIHLLTVCGSARSAALVQQRGCDLLYLAGIPVTTGWRAGAAAEAIIAACAEEQAPLLFLGASQRRLARWLSAGTAEAVLAGLDIPACVCPAL